MSLIITACPLIGCPYHAISLREHDWLILNYGVILAQRVMNLGPGAGDPGRAVPPPGNENFMKLSPDNGNKLRPPMFY